MKADLKQYTVREVIDGFIFNELEGKGLYGLAGKLVIQPEYQRHYIYGDGRMLFLVHEIAWPKDVPEEMYPLYHDSFRERIIKAKQAAAVPGGGEE